MIQLHVHGDPKGQPRPRAYNRNGKVGMYDAGTADGWKASIQFAALAALEDVPVVPLAGPFSVEIAFCMKRPKSHFRANGDLKETAPTFVSKKPDIDNMAKAVLDALTQAGVWRDDAEVSVLGCIKKFGLPVGAIITINQENEQ